MYLLFMDIFDNSLSGGSITFKVFDASTGQIYSDVNPQLTFTANQMYGTPSNPVEINTTIGIEQEVTLSKGWNWISFNVFNNNFNNINTVLRNMQASQNDIVKSSESYAQFSTNGTWLGNLSSLNYKEMYKMKVGTSQNLVVSGASIISDTVSIPIVQGWNWIGYPAQKQMNITAAMSSLTLSSNDILKSQNKFAVYDKNLGWLGSLTYLQSGKGYMFKSASNGNLVFTGGSKNDVLEKEKAPEYELTASNMTLIAELDKENPEIYTVYAYKNGAICGIAQPSFVSNKVLFFITVNAESGDLITFAAKNPFENNTANEQLTFVDNANFGTFETPYKLLFTQTGIENLTSENTLEVYPNPFSNQLFVKVNLAKEVDLKVELFNLIGIKMSETASILYPKGTHVIELKNNAENLEKGVYFVKISTPESEQILKIVKQ